MMSRIGLNIYYTDNGVSKLRCSVNKWKFQDSMMGEQFITFTITSENPIDWAVGDFCEFRGETFTLNYVPSVTQKAGTKETQEAYTYENVKFESPQEELSRIIMLDITATTGAYVPALGTNYTGSSKFQLFCGESSVIVSGETKTFTAVCALAAKMQANLDRAYPNTWNIYVDTETTYVNPSGKTYLVTHTDDKVLSFDNTTVAQALSEVHNTFDLDYCVKGRNIYIGFSLKNLTNDDEDETFAFGYGKGYPTHDESGTGLFQIKRIANSQQKIVTRLRALGSTKNMPYRYYNKHYDLSQSLFPTNLQLPDTFETPSVKESHNSERDTIYGINPLTNLPYIRHVKGETNDAYIDKGDDADNCAEGVREDCACWDGSNGELQEIYPTIEEATYGELRAANVNDQDGQSGSNAFPNYGNDERVDELLAIGYLDNGTLIDDANQGGGILPESDTTDNGIPRSAIIPLTTLAFNTADYGDFTYNGSYYLGIEKPLFTIADVFPGKYAMVPTGPNYDSVRYGFQISSDQVFSAKAGFIINIKQKSKSSGNVTTIASYISDFTSAATAVITEVSLPEIPDAKEGSSAKVEEISVTEFSDILVTFVPIISDVALPYGYTGNFVYQVGKSRISTDNPYEPEYTWISLDDNGNLNDVFHVFIKDMGFDITACWTNETPVVAMKSGRCVGREFEIGENIEKVTYNGKKGYMLTLHRATDSNLNTYYPSVTDPIVAGDNFVLLNINMPEAYIKMAEVRLLRAATDYLADNCDTQFTYQPYIDDIYLQRNYDNMLAAGTVEESIFWRLYAGLKLTFRGIPANEDDPLPLIDLTIEQVAIQMGDGLTPKVEMTLNDDIQQTTLQKLTTAVDRIYNGSLFGNGSGSGSGANAAALLSILQTDGGKLFLSKKHSDRAQERIIFDRGIDTGSFIAGKQGSRIDATGDAEFGKVNARESVSVGEYIDGSSGARISVDENGTSAAEFDFLTIRRAAKFREITIQELKHIGGELALTAAAMECCRVEAIDQNGNIIDISSPLAMAYKLYFETTDGDKTIYQEFVVGDQARCQQFKLESDAGGYQSTKYYWRIVKEVGDDYIVLSNVQNEYDGTSIPAVGDKIVQLGYRKEYNNNEDISYRTTAIILSATSNDAPSTKYYQDITSFSLENVVKDEGYDDGVFHANIYGKSYSGAKDRSGYVEYTPQDGLNVKGVLNIGTTLNDGTDVNNLITGNINLLLNSGFTGDFKSIDVTPSQQMDGETQIFSPSLKYWTHDSGCITGTSVDSASGYECQLKKNSVLSQSIDNLPADSNFIVSLKAKGKDVTISFGGTTKTYELSNTSRYYAFKVTVTNGSTLTISTVQGCVVCEPMVAEGNVFETWSPSPQDNDKTLEEIYGFDYLMYALSQASTTINKGLVLTQLIKVGNYRNGLMVEETGGMSGLVTDEDGGETDPFVWGGGTMDQALYAIMKYQNNPSYQATDEEVSQMAKFVVTHGGRAILNDIILRGYIYAKGGVFKNVRSPNGNFHIDDNGDLSVTRSGRNGGFYIEDDFITNENKGGDFNESSTLFFNVNNGTKVAAIGGSVVAASSGLDYAARFENNKEGDGYLPVTENRAMRVCAKNAVEKNIAIDIIGGCISGLAYSVSTANNTPFNIPIGCNFVLCGSNSSVVNLPSLTNERDGYSVKIKNDSGGSVTIHTSNKFDDGNTQYELAASKYMEFVYCSHLQYNNSDPLGLWIILRN